MQRQVRKAVLVCFAVIVGSAAINLLSHPPDGLHALAAEIMINTKSGPSGDYLVDGDGNSLYVFEKDTPSTSTCTGDCALLWPPLVSAEGDTVGVGGGAQGDRLNPNPFVRPDGGRQVVYADHPLYKYAKDRQPGDTSGNNVDSFGGKWCLLSPAGFTLCNNAATGTAGGAAGRSRGRWGWPRSERRPECWAQCRSKHGSEFGSERWPKCRSERWSESGARFRTGSFLCALPWGFALDWVYPSVWFYWQGVYVYICTRRFRL